jgi:pre-mRNA-splicing factor ISY1
LTATAGLTDYEVRDLNDEINRLMREKRHWENQIVALGGANYRRNVAMLDDDGKEVPGTKGYKSVLTSHHIRNPLLILDN